MRATATAVALTLLAVLHASAAQAGGLQGQSTRSAMSLGSGRWQAVATSSTAAPYPTVAFAITAPAGTPSGSTLYLNIVNTGTVTISSASYTLTASPATNVALEVCTGSWNESTDACSGAIRTLDSTSAGPSSSTSVPAAAGASLRVRLRLLAAAQRHHCRPDRQHSAQQRARPAPPAPPDRRHMARAEQPQPADPAADRIVYPAAADYREAGS